MLILFFFLPLSPLLHCHIVRRATNLGSVHGVVYSTPRGNKAEKYLGLPYAQKPTGPRRFEYPLPLERWPETPYNATYTRSICVQLGDGWNLIGNEDCLYLNIFRPVATTNLNKFPVLVWIHGGSYEAGGGSQFNVDGAIDNFASRGIILVTINYRLSLLGFMSLLNGSLPGNYGLEDQLQALEWVNENIEDFGGDKKSITICGESAGAASVNLLTFSPKAQGLFHRAIIISGTAIAPWAVAPKTTKGFTENIVNSLRCQSARTILECLKRVNVDVLFDIYLASMIRNNKEIHLSRITPVPDRYRRQNALLPFPPRYLLNRRIVRVPVLMGLTSGELPDHEDMTWDELLPYNRLVYGLKSLKMIKEWYQKINIHDKLEGQRRKIRNDYTMNVPMCLLAKVLKRLGSPVFFYRYDLRNVITNNLPYHGADVAFLFNNRSLIPNKPPNETLPLPSWPVYSMIFDSFRNFIKTGNPNQPTKLSSFWPEYRGDGASSVVWFKNDKVLLTDCYEEETSFWKSLDQEYALF